MNVGDLLLSLAPSIVQGLTARGVPEPHAKAAVAGAVQDAATAHDRAQDARLTAIEARLAALESE